MTNSEAEKEVRRLLADYFGPEKPHHPDRWMKLPNILLGNMTPEEMIKQGRAEKLMETSHTKKTNTNLVMKTLKLRIYPRPWQQDRLKLMMSGANEAWNFVNEMVGQRVSNDARLIARTTKNGTPVTKKIREGEAESGEYVPLDWNIGREKKGLSIPYASGEEKIMELPLFPGEIALFHFVGQYTQIGKLLSEKFALPMSSAAQVVKQYCTNYQLYLKSDQWALYQNNFKLKKRELPDWLPFRDGQVKPRGSYRIGFAKMVIRMAHDIDLSSDEFKGSVLGGDSALLNGRFTQEQDGTWWLNVAVAAPTRIVNHPRTILGADPGMNVGLTLSNGQKLIRPRYKNLIRRRRRLAKMMNKGKGGKQRYKYNEDGSVVYKEYFRFGKSISAPEVLPLPSIQKKLRKLDNKITRKKRVWEWAVANDIARVAHTVYVGNLSLKAMQRANGRGVLREAVHTLKNAIAHKMKQSGGILIEINEKYTTRMCSNCHLLTGPNGVHDLKIRTWVCSSCATKHDRDINAAINIKLCGEDPVLFEKRLKHAKHVEKEKALVQSKPRRRRPVGEISKAGLPADGGLINIGKVEHKPGAAIAGVQNSQRRIKSQA